MKENLKYRRCIINNKAEYWFDVIIGGILTFTIIFLVGNLSFMKFNLEYLNAPYCIFCILIVVYFQWKDDNFKVIETELSIKDNFELTEKALEKLGWKYKKSTKEIELIHDNNFLLKFLEITIIPSSKVIYFNFKYHSTWRTGRFPFFFGISWIMEWKFKRNILKQLNRTANSGFAQ
jgi:hypothetical protein